MSVIQQFKYLCDVSNPAESSSPVFNGGVKLNFASAVKPNITEDITFDFDNLVYGKDATVQDAMVNIGTRQGSNPLNEDEGTTLQEDTLNYALVSSNYLTHTCNFAGSDTKFFENQSIGSLNNILADYFNSQQTTVQSTVEANTTYVNSITDLVVTPYKFTYDKAILTLQFTFDDQTIIGEIELNAEF